MYHEEYHFPLWGQMDLVEFGSLSLLNLSKLFSLLSSSSWNLMSPFDVYSASFTKASPELTFVHSHRSSGRKWEILPLIIAAVRIMKINSSTSIL